MYNIVQIIEIQEYIMTAVECATRYVASLNTTDCGQSTGQASEEARVGPSVPTVGGIFDTIPNIKKAWKDIQIAWVIKDYSWMQERAIHLISNPFRLLGGIAFFHYYVMQFGVFIRIAKIIHERYVSLQFAISMQWVLAHYCYPIIAAGCLIDGISQSYNIYREIKLLRSDSMKEIRKITHAKFTSDEDKKGALVHALENLKAMYAVEGQSDNTSIDEQLSLANSLLLKLKNGETIKSDEYSALGPLEMTIENAKAKIIELKRKSGMQAQLSAHFGKTFSFLSDPKYFEGLQTEVKAGNFEETEKLLKDLPIEAYKRITVFALGVLAALITAISLIIFTVSPMTAFALFAGAGFFSFMKSRLVKSWLITRGWHVSTIDFIPWGRSVVNYL
jgi:hypothetical protein